MNPEVKKRLKWIRVYEKTKNAGMTCLRFGISRPTLRKWFLRYEAEGIAGLENRSRRPQRSPNTKVSKKDEEWILKYRKAQLGARRIQSELIWRQNFHLSLAPIHKVLKRNKVQPLKKVHRKAPIDRVVERSSETPITDEVEAMYDPSKEHIREANYSLDLQILKLKGCL